MKKETEQLYRDHSAISFSDLKLLYDSPARFHALKYGTAEELGLKRKESTGYKVGDIVDCLTLYPDDFDDHFIVKTEEMKEPSSPNMIKFLSLYDKDIPIAKAYEDSYSTRGLKKIDIENKGLALIKELMPYINFRDSIGDRRLVAEVDINIAKICVQVLKENPFAKGFFWGDRWSERFTQKVIKGTVDDILFKCMVDLILVDDNSKTVWVIDLKTIGRSMSIIRKQVRMFHYDEQLVFYLMMILRWISAKRPELTDYTFRLVNTFVQTEPLYEVDIVEYSQEYISLATVKIDKLIERLTYHIETDKWDMSMERHKNRGITLLTPNEEREWLV